MSTYSFCAPVVSGKTDTLRKYAQELTGKRREQYYDYMRKAGLDLEQTWIQTTPNGDFIVVRWETNDPNKVMQYGMTSEDTFVKWFRDNILIECLGLDPASPLPSLNQQLVNFEVQTKREKSYSGRQGR